MLHHPLCPAVVCLALSFVSPTLQADPITVTNFKPDETIRYPVAFLKGTLDDDAVRKITVVNQSSHRPTRQLQGTAYKGRFKALAELVPGPNQLLLSSGGHELTLTLHYKPQTNPYRVQLIYMTDRSGNTRYQTQRPNDPQNYRDKIDTMMKLLQSFTAEQMNELGFGRLTFNLDFDKNGRVIVHQFTSARPASFFEALDDVPLYHEVSKEIESQFHDPHIKRAVYLAFQRYDRALQKMVASNARAGGGTAECGAGAFWAWPGSLAEVFPAFLDRTPIRADLVGDDTEGRSTVWGLNGMSGAVMLHELMHTWGLPHSKVPDDVIAGRGFHNFNRFFTLYEPPCKRNRSFNIPPDSEAAHITPISGSALKNSRWFALDDKPWKDGDAPRLSPSGKEDVLIESEHGLAYLGLDLKGDAIGFMSFGGPGQPEPPHRFVLTSWDMTRLAGTTEVRIRAVDVEDQKTDAEVNHLGYDTTVYPATSEAVEIQVPSGRKLVLDVHFHFPRAEPEGDLGVYLPKTRERVFVANATGTPEQHWESPVNASGKPITYSIVGYYKVRSKIEEPWRIAHKDVTEGPKVSDIAFQGKRATGPGGGAGSSELLEPVDVSTAHVEVK